MSTETCNRCEGKGVALATNVATELTTCYGCKGSGKMQRCERCYGTGHAQSMAEALSDWRCEDCGGAGQVNHHD